MERVKHGDIRSHHSFLFPTSVEKEFEYASKYIPNWKNFEDLRQNTQQIEQFWSGYSVVDSTLAIIGPMIWLARFSKIVKDCIASQLVSKMEELETYILLKIPDSFDERTAGQTLENAKLFANEIREVNRLLLDALSQSDNLKNQTAELMEALKSYQIGGKGVRADVEMVMNELLDECKTSSREAMNVVLPKLVNMMEKSQSIISNNYQVYRNSVPKLQELPITTALQVQQLDEVMGNLQRRLLPEASRNARELTKKVAELNIKFDEITQTLIDVGLRTQRLS